MAVLTAAAAMATVTIEDEKRPPIMTSLCVAVRDCDELFFEQLDRWYRSWAHKKMLDWPVCFVAPVLEQTAKPSRLPMLVGPLAATDPPALDNAGIRLDIMGREIFTSV